MKKIAILQSNYIPWKGYFDLINSVDEFIIYDCVQFTKNDWRNRNKIKTQNGLIWITIPVKHSITQKISEIETLNNNWRKKHWNSIINNYSKSKYFKKYSDFFYELYNTSEEINLHKINIAFINQINSILNISTKITDSYEYQLKGDRVERLVNICKQAGASEYISGPSAKVYLDVEMFAMENIKVSWIDYSNYPEYTQLHGEFEHSVSILDLIFNEGENALNFMKSFNTK